MTSGAVVAMDDKNGNGKLWKINRTTFYGDVVRGRKKRGSKKRDMNQATVPTHPCCKLCQKRIVA